MFDIVRRQQHDYPIEEENLCKVVNAFMKLLFLANSGSVLETARAFDLSVNHYFKPVAAGPKRNEESKAHSIMSLILQFRETFHNQIVYRTQKVAHKCETHF